MENPAHYYPQLPPENSVTYDCPYTVYAMAISSSADSCHRCRRSIAIGSFIEDLSNRVDVISFDEETHALKPIPGLSFDHAYPPTKLTFHLNPSAAELLVSSGAFLRLWEVADA